MIGLSDRQLQDFHDALQWTTAMRLPDGRVLGVPGKRGAISDDNDFRVRAVAERLQPTDKTVLELGAHEGIHTVQLAAVAKHVVAVEVRPKNVVAALTRLFVHDVSNARVVLKDVRELDERFGRFDVLFHVGVLYHLSDPVRHLFAVAPLAAHLLLDTHYGEPPDEGDHEELDYGGRRYGAYRIREGGWGDAFSGVEEMSRWLDRDSLLELVRDVGFSEVEVLDDRAERNGARITLIASKSTSRRGDSR